MNVPVVWVSYRQPEVIARGYMDQGTIEHLFVGTLGRLPSGLTFSHYTGFGELQAGTRGAVVVLPAQHHTAPEHIERLNADLARLDWCVLMLTGDECSLFPWDQLRHPAMRLWVMTPRPHLHAASGARFVGEGPGYPDMRDIVRAHEAEAMEKSLPWFFAGQVTHGRRRACVAALRRLATRVRGSLVETPGFLQGMDRHEYLAAMAAAKVAPCPSGPGTPDSFRLYEALEAGALPLADAVTPDGWTGYWPFLVGGEPPFPVVDDWRKAPDLVRAALARWPRNVNRAVAWWVQHKRAMANWLAHDIATLSGEPFAPATVADQVTVLVPTSPVPSHPSTAVIEETVASIRAQPDLADAEIVIACDGVREEQSDRAPAYHEYVRRLLWLAQHRWRNVVVVLADEHVHQAGVTRLALDHVRTPLLLFVEHDTPLCGPVPWGELADVVSSGALNLVRFHHEAHVLDVHQHLMVDHTKRWDGADVPLMRTMQWSQRPHLARAGWYRDLLARYFGSQSRTMIEDVMHGVVDHAWRTRRLRGWEEWRLALYAPRGDMKRSLHTDGRAGEPKYEFVFAYDGETPEGAPRPTSERVAEPVCG